MRKPLLFGVPCALVLAAAVGIACSSEENPVPPDTTFKTDTGTGSETTTPVDTGSAPTDSGAPGDATDADASDAPRDTAGCVTEAGCFACPPAVTPEFLDRCSSNDCVPFDNKTRIPGWDGGALPSVP